LITTRKDLNSLGKKIANFKESKVKYNLPVVTKPRIRITFSMTKVLGELVEKGLIIRKGNGEFFPSSFKPALSYEIERIVPFINSIFRGVANYYVFCDN